MMPSIFSKIPHLIYLLLGIGNLLFGFLIFKNFEYLSEKDHALLEVAAALILVAMLCFWIIKNLERSAPVRYFLMVFFLLLCFIHWLDYYRMVVEDTGGAWFNTLPIAGLLLAEILIRFSKNKTPDPIPTNL